ncbi:MAG: hypothetical protein ACPG5Z_00215 [Pseudoalteromonas sp.]
MPSASDYFRAAGAADLGGAYQKGLSIGDMIRKKKMQEGQMERSSNLRDIMGTKGALNEENFQNTIGQVAQYSPEMALKMKNQQYQRDRLAEDRKYRRGRDVKEDQFREDSLNLKKSVTERDLRDKSKELFVPGMGYALNKDDAKKLKSAKEMKGKFDREVGELIDLREKFGVEYFNRDAVGRGKQLSKKLLLTYKNLAKLGVLSKSDEAIVDAIIPTDPLGQDWMPGQDSTLHVLKKFREDLDKDYTDTVKTRLDPSRASAPVKFTKEQIRKEIEKRKNMVKK